MIWGEFHPPPTLPEHEPGGQSSERRETAKNLTESRVFTSVYVEKTIFGTVLLLPEAVNTCQCGNTPGLFFLM